MRGSRDLPLVGRTYVSRNFVSPNHTHRSPGLQQPTESLGRACVTNEAIFALGVALIEISFGVPILSLKEENCDPDLPGLTEFFIASRLVTENVIKGRDHDKYAEVVLRCVKGQLSNVTSPLSLDDVKVQHSFYEDVIMPLDKINKMLYDEDVSII